MIQKRSRGFTLVELAIVMGAIGLIMGGVWVIAGRAMEASTVEQAVEQLAVINKNVRSYYMAQPSIASADVTTALADAKVFPQEMIRSGSSPALVDHPWGPARPNGVNLSAGGVGVSGSNSYYYILTYRGLKTSSCVAFATKVATGATAVGLTAFSINGTAITLPLTVDTVVTQCSVNGGTTGTDVVLTYRLRG